MRHRLITALSAAALLGALTACQAVQDAGNAADKTSICLEALRLANFSPSTQNLEQTAQDAKKTSEELTGLAERAADTTLRDAINGMAEQVQSLSVPNLDPTTVTNWAQQKLTAFTTLAQACG